MDKANRKSCTCRRCSQPCKTVPGWFMPGEVEQAAKLLGLSLRAFFRRYVGITFRSRKPTVFALAPSTRSMKAGAEYPADPRGECVFLTREGRCAIHAAKPYECRMYDHSMTDAEHEVVVNDLIAAWEPHQSQIHELVGRKQLKALDAVRDSATGKIMATFDHTRESLDSVLDRLNK